MLIEKIDEAPNYSFGNLPREIAVEIFSYLEIQDLGRLLIVSKGVNQLAKAKKVLIGLEMLMSVLEKIRVKHGFGH